jgi:hypothetical protein
LMPIAHGTPNRDPRGKFFFFLEAVSTLVEMRVGTTEFPFPDLVSGKFRLPSGVWSCNDFLFIVG